MKRFLIVSMAIVAAAAIASTTTAGPIPPQPLVPNVQGQSRLVSPLGTVVNVDWGVRDGCEQFTGGVFGPGSGCIAYLYQLENDAARAVTGFSIPFDTSNLFFPAAIRAGYSSGFDLDTSLTLHNTVADPSLVGETEPAGGQVPIDPITIIQITPAPVPPGGANGGVLWQWGATGVFLNPGFETGVFWVLSATPPVYGNASALGDGGFSWASAQTTGEPIPTNQILSEPGTLLLLGLGLGALGVRFRRRREEN